MSTVEIGGRQVTVQRFTLAKAMRVITLLQLIQKQVPEVSREWADFRRRYAEDYATQMDRIQAVARFGLDHVSDDDWERAGQKFSVPGVPSNAEVFFQMAPLVYERAEAVTLRLLGLIAMENDLVDRYVAKGDIWDRVDEFVDEIIRPAELGEIMELLVVAAEVIDGTVLAKARSLSDRAGNVARLLGMKKSEDSQTSSEPPVQPNTVSVSGSPEGSDGTPSGASGSPGTSSTTSPTSTPLSTISTP